MGWVNATRDYNNAGVSLGIGSVAQLSYDEARQAENVRAQNYATFISQANTEGQDGGGFNPSIPLVLGNPYQTDGRGGGSYPVITGADALGHYFGYDYCVMISQDINKPFWISANWTTTPSMNAVGAQPLHGGTGIGWQSAETWDYDVSSHSFTNGFMTIPVGTLLSGVDTLDFVRLGIDEKRYVFWCIAILTYGTEYSAINEFQTSSSPIGKFVISARNAGSLDLERGSFGSPQSAIYFFGQFLTTYNTEVDYIVAASHSNDPFGKLIEFVVIAAILYIGGGALGLYGTASPSLPGALTASDVNQAATVFPVNTSGVTLADLNTTDISALAPVTTASTNGGVFYDMVGNAYTTSDAAAASDAALNAITVNENVAAAAGAASDVTSGLPALSAALSEVSTPAAALTIAQQAASVAQSAVSSGDATTAAAALTTSQSATATAAAALAKLPDTVKALPAIAGLIGALNRASSTGYISPNTPVVPLSTTQSSGGILSAFSNLSPAVKSLLLPGGIIAAALLVSSRRKK